MKAFWEEVEARVGAMSAAEARDVMRRMAREVAPADRRAFVERLSPAKDEAAGGLENAAGLRGLPADIASLERRLRTDMRDPDGHMESRSGWDDDDADGEGYTGYETELADLFDRGRAAFELGQFGLAQQAYAGLIRVLGIEDDYGFRVERPEALDIREERARYLRAVAEDGPPGQRAQGLMDALRFVMRELWDAEDVSLEELFEISPSPLAGRDALLEDAIALLARGKEREDDRWLREATRLRHGAQGLARLARSEGRRRPRAWIDWLDAAAGEMKPGQLLDAAKEALAGLPDGLDLRALAADHMCHAAVAAGDSEQAMAARWEAFRAQPWPNRILDIWEAADGSDARRDWMSQAVEFLRSGGGALVPGHERAIGSKHDALFLEEGDGFDEDAGSRALICAGLLLGDWRGPFEKAREEPPLGWSSGDRLQPMVLPIMLAWLGGWPALAPAGHVDGLLGEALGSIMGEWRDDPTGSTDRMRAALAEAVADWESPEDSQKLLRDCAALASKRVDAIVSAGHRGAYGRAAVLAAAVAETTRALGDTAGAERVFDDLLARHNRKTAFKRELAAARGGAQRKPGGRAAVSSV